MTKKRWAIVVFILLGIVKMPLEDHLDQKLLDLKLHDPLPDVGVMGQVRGAFIQAVLGGLRSLAASIAYLEAWTAWDRTDWGGVDSMMRITTILEPRDDSYWDEASWQMAYNAADYYFYEGKMGFGDVKVSTNPLAYKQYRDYARRGADIAEEGLKYLPHNRRLLQRLGDIYRDRLQIHEKAWPNYLDAFNHGALEYFQRLAAYEMVKTQDRAAWEKAYRILKDSYDTGKGTPSVLRDLPVLEERLGIPMAQRIDPKAPPPARPGFRKPLFVPRSK